jgi:hypothetical protein
MSDKSNKNNFKDPSMIEKSVYKLLIYFKPHLSTKYRLPAGQNGKVYYGFNTKPDKGLQSLINLAEKYRQEYTIAILYNAQENCEIRKFAGL